MQTNDTLPQNLKQMIDALSLEQAVPLGEMEGIPILAIKLSDENKHYIQEGGLLCELKASIFNVDFGDDIIALCFVQVRLEKSPELIFTVSYDLNVEKQFEDCYSLLNMKKYGLLVGSSSIYEFMSFENVFEAEFDPRIVLNEAKATANDYTHEKFVEVSYAIKSQVRCAAVLWMYLSELAPFEKSWYGRMNMGKSDA
jgi:hypothetical protein